MKQQFIRLFWGTQKSVPLFLILLPVSIMLWLASVLYGIAIKGYVFYFTRMRSPQVFSVPIISVGNVTCGGTGKSVLVHYLLQRLPGAGGVVMRGYGGANERTKQPLLVCDNGKNFSSVRNAGDEASALAMHTSAPIVVSSDKRDAISYLCSWREQMERPLSYIIVDDGYQQVTIAKKVNVLLLDARAPLGNGKLLPAGPLRERDLSRANIVLFTHKEGTGFAPCDEIKHALTRERGPSFVRTAVFACQHKMAGLWRGGAKKVGSESVDGRRFYATGGVGSFSGFLATLRQNDIVFEKQRQFLDHHAYTIGDMHEILKAARETDGIITTQKDWAKLEPLVQAYAPHTRERWFVARVTLSFDSDNEEGRFLARVQKLLKQESYVA